MIRKNTVRCKLILLLFLSQKHMDKLYCEFDMPCRAGKETCPACDASGGCVEHESYSRTVIDFVSDEVRPRHIWVTRVKCFSCGHTHAILFDPVILYMRYSLLFILRVLYAYLNRKRQITALTSQKIITQVS